MKLRDRCFGYREAGFGSGGGFWHAFGLRRNEAEACKIERFNEEVAKGHQNLEEELCNKAGHAR